MCKNLNIDFYLAAEFGHENKQTFRANVNSMKAFENIIRFEDLKYLKYVGFKWDLN